MARSSFGIRFPQRDAAAARLLAKNVKRLRKSRGLTQDQLAAELEVEQSAISLIENARANPGLLLLDAMTEIFGCHIRELFDEDDTSATAASGCIPGRQER